MRSPIRIPSLAALLLLPVPALAVTQAFFPQGDSRAVIMIKPNPMDAWDRDPEKLYDSMSVPPRQTPIATGKTIETADKSWSLVCGIQNNRTICTLSVKAGPHSRISALRGTAEFDLQGEEAATLASFFALTDGFFGYSTADGTLRIEARHDGSGAEFHCAFQR